MFSTIPIKIRCAMKSRKSDFRKTIESTAKEKGVPPLEIRLRSDLHHCKSRIYDVIMVVLAFWTLESGMSSTDFATYFRVRVFVSVARRLALSTFH